MPSGDTKEINLSPKFVKLFTHPQALTHLPSAPCFTLPAYPHCLGNPAAPQGTGTDSGVGNPWTQLSQLVGANALSLFLASTRMCRRKEESSVCTCIFAYVYVAGLILGAAPCQEAILAYTHAGTLNRCKYICIYRNMSVLAHSLYVSIWMLVQTHLFIYLINLYPTFLLPGDLKRLTVFFSSVVSPQPLRGR